MFHVVSSKPMPILQSLTQVNSCGTDRTMELFRTGDGFHLVQHLTFTVRRLSAALLLLRQSSELVASTQWVLSLLGPLLILTHCCWSCCGRRTAKTLRTRHRDLKLFQDFIAAVGGSQVILVLISGTIAVHWGEENTGEHRGDNGKKLREWVIRRSLDKYDQGVITEWSFQQQRFLSEI